MPCIPARVVIIKPISTEVVRTDFVQPAAYQRPTNGQTKPCQDLLR